MAHKENRTGCDNKRPKSQVQCNRVCRTVEGSVWPAYPSLQLAKQLCLTCWRKRQHQMSDITASRVHVVTPATASAKKFKNLPRRLFPSLPLQPSHDTTANRKNGGTSTVCVFPSLVTSESLGSRFTCDQHRKHDATAHDGHSI